MKVETGKHYWFRHNFEKIWHVCYIGEDHDDNQWLHQIGCKPLEVTQSLLLAFEFIEIKKAEGGGVMLTREDKEWIRDEIKKDGGVGCGCLILVVLFTLLILALV